MVAPLERPSGMLGLGFLTLLSFAWTLIRRSQMAPDSKSVLS